MSNELSYFVNKEISDLCDDEEFAFKSQEVLWKLSDLAGMEEEERDENFDQCSLNSFELAKRNHFSDTESVCSDLFVKIDLPEQQEEIEPLEIFVQEEKPCAVSNDEPKQSDDNSNGISSEKKDSQVIYIWSTSDASSCQEEQQKKGKSPREVEPTNFLSLKRKDVIFKSIFRMMRRFFCQLLEDHTDYNRKEKWINTKHKQLVKYISEGMEKLNFNSFGKNMSFYFAAFAYPSDKLNNKNLLKIKNIVVYFLYNVFI